MFFCGSEQGNSARCVFTFLEKISMAEHKAVLTPTGVTSALR